MVASGFGMDTLEILGIAEYVYESNCAAPTWIIDSDADVYYLDSTGSVTVNFIISNSNANTYEWDFGDDQFEITTGSVSHTYSITGEISVGIHGCMTNCLPLNSCTDQIVDFQIIDTLSSIRYIPGENLGIRLYPNPASELITIELPQALNFKSYKILDMTGRLLMTSQINSLNVEIPVDALEPGIYSVVLLEGNRLDQQGVIIKFSVNR
jgi:hypothetical protein